MNEIISIINQWEQFCIFLSFLDFQNKFYTPNIEVQKLKKTIKIYIALLRQVRQGNNNHCIRKLKMKLSQQHISELSNQIATKTKDSQFSNPLVISEVLTMLIEQKPCFSEFEFLGQGEFSLVLKAKNSSGYVALKIVESHQSKQKIIESLQREYEILKSLQTSEYILKMYDSFFLIEEKNEEGSAKKEEKSKQPGSVSTVNRYFVQETELCQGNLAEYLGVLRKNSIILEERVKLCMAAQILDAVNFLHMRNIAHRDIKPSNFLYQEREEIIILKLCNFRFATPLDQQNSTSYLTEVGNPGYSAPEVEQGQSGKESDNYALGIIILEIDNSPKFDYSKVTIAEFGYLQQGQGIFLKHNLDTSSVLFSIAETLLQPKYQDRSTAQQILLLLLEQQHNILKNIPIYSIFQGNPLSLLPSPIPELQDKNTQQLEKLKSISTQLNSSSDETIKKKIDSLVEAYQKSDNTSSLTQIQTEGVLQTLFMLGDYDNFQLLGTGSQGIIIGVLNKKQQRQSALKICLCNNKAEIFRQISILKKCQMPRIVQFYGYQFIQDENNNEYVVFEMERCKSSLTQYLNEKCENNQPCSPELKMELAIQMIDSVNYLHELEILHRDIKLDNYLIQEDEKGVIVVKLADFDQAAQLEENYCWKWVNPNHDDELLPPCNCTIFLDKLGTFPYYAPERFNPLHPTTAKTDAYSLGLCLLILDNYLTFQEETLIKKYQILILPYSEPFLECEEVKIDRESQIYLIAKKLLAYLPNNRSTLQKIMQDQQSKQICYFKQAKTQEKINLEEIINQISSLTNLSSLSLNFSSTSIGDSGIVYLITELIKLVNLSSLSLNLVDNSIGETGIIYIFTALIKLINLSNLSVNLSCNEMRELGVIILSTQLSKLVNLSSLSLYLSGNKIGGSSVNYLAKGLSKLNNLSSLSLNLEGNSIGESGVNYISTELIKLINLSSLCLELSRNLIGESGMNYLSTALIKFTNLSSLSLELCDNSIGGEGVNNFSTSLSKLIYLSNLSLDLSCNSIGDQGIQFLSTALIKLINLSSLRLDLDRNSIKESGGDYLSTALNKLINLSSLSLKLCTNQIGDSGLNYLSTALMKLINLSNLYLYLSGNLIGEQGVNYLSNALSKLINLSSLSLKFCYNSIGNEGLSNLSNSLSKLVNLSSLSLDLSHTSIGDSGIQFLSNELMKLIDLSNLCLNLSDNLIGESGGNYISTALVKLINLLNLSLELWGNSIRESGVYNISTSLSQLVNLQSLYLDLCDNSIRDSGVNYLSTGLIKLTNLSCLSLNLLGNSIGEQGVSNLSISLSKLINLSILTLILSDNSIGDLGVNYLSTELSKLLNLSSLYLEISNNSIRESGVNYLSTELIKLINLSSLTLDLNNNSIEDSGVNHLSSSLHKLIKLSSLNLYLCSNSIGNSGVNNLLAGLIKLINLSCLSLHLSGNSIEESSKNYLSTEIKNLNLKNKTILF